MTKVRKLAVGETTGKAPKAKVRRVNHYERRALMQHSYEPDEHELVPQPTKAKQEAHELEVELAEAKKAHIDSKETLTHYQAGERPPVKFKGTVVVSDVSEEEWEAAEANQDDTPEAEEGVADASDAATEDTTTDDDTATDETTEGTGRLSFTEKLEQVFAADDDAATAHTASATAARDADAADTAEAENQPSHATASRPKAGTKLTVTSEEADGHDTAVISSRHRQASSERTATRRPQSQQSQHGVIGMTRTPAPDEVAPEPVRRPVAVAPDTTPANHVPIVVHVGLVAVALVCMVGVLGLEQVVVVEDGAMITKTNFSFAQLWQQLERLQSALFAHVGGS